MGLGTNMFIIFFIICAGLSLVNPTEWGSPMMNFFNATGSTGYVDLGSFVSDTEHSGFIGKIGLIFGLSVLTGIVASVFGGDAIYGLISGFLIFMLGVTIVPINFFFDNNIPFFVKVLVGVPFAMMYALSLIGWWRGSEF